MKIFKLLLVSKPDEIDRLCRFGVSIHSKGISGAEARAIAYGRVRHRGDDPEAKNFQTEYIRNGETVFVGTSEFTQVEWSRMRDLLASEPLDRFLYCLWRYDNGWVKTRTDNTGTGAQRPREVLAELGITCKEECL